MFIQIAGVAGGVVLGLFITLTLGFNQWWQIAVSLVPSSLLGLSIVVGPQEALKTVKASWNNAYKLAQSLMEKWQKKLQQDPQPQQLSDPNALARYCWKTARLVIISGMLALVLRLVENVWIPETNTTFSPAIWWAIAVISLVISIVIFERNSVQEALRKKIRYMADNQKLSTITLPPVNGTIYDRNEIARIDVINQWIKVHFIQADWLIFKYYCKTVIVFPLEILGFFFIAAIFWVGWITELLVRLVDEKKNGLSVLCGIILGILVGNWAHYVGLQILSCWIIGLSSGVGLVIASYYAKKFKSAIDDGLKAAANWLANWMIESPNKWSEH